MKTALDSKYYQSSVLDQLQKGNEDVRVATHLLQGWVDLDAIKVQK